MTFDEYWKVNSVPYINWGPHMYKDVAKAAWDAANKKPIDPNDVPRL